MSSAVNASFRGNFLESYSLSSTKRVKDIGRKATKRDEEETFRNVRFVARNWCNSFDWLYTIMLMIYFSIGDSCGGRIEFQNEARERPAL